MLLLKSFKRNRKGFADLLKYMLLWESEVLLCKDGSFLAMYEFRGKDTTSSTQDDLNYVAKQINEALKGFGDGWAIHVDAARSASTYYPTNNNFPKNFVAKAIDKERQAFFSDATCYQTKQYLTISYLPHYATAKVTASVSGQKMQKIEDEVGRGLRAFKHALSAFEDIAKTGLATLRRLGEYTEENAKYSELLEAIHYIINGQAQQIRLPPCPMYLDAILSSQDLIGGASPKLGEKYIAVVSIDGFPQSSHPAILKALDKLPLEYRFNTRFIALSKESAAKEIKMMQKGWNQKVFTAFAQLFQQFTAKPNSDALRMVDDCELAADWLSTDYVSFGYLSSGVVLLEENIEILEEAARLVRKTIQGLGFSCRIETINTMEAWLGSHPANTYANIRRPLIHSLNLAHFLPLASTWHGNINNRCPLYPANSPCLAVLVTDGNTPFYFSPHVSDVGHMFICGGTGSGKSTFLGFQAVQFLRYKNAQVFCIDKSRSMKILCDALGGKHFDLGVDKDISFAPLADIDSDERLAWATGWVENLVNLQGEAQVTAKQRNFIAEALQELSRQPVPLRTLSGLLTLFSTKDDFLADSIKNYTLAGTEGRLLDASESAIEFSQFTVFEIEELMNRKNNILIPVLEYLFALIERSLTGVPSLLILDEAWIMFDHPVLRGKIREWLKMFRKKNCAVILATQQLTDAANSSIFDVLMDSCPTKVWLANLEAKNNEYIRNIYAKAGLNNRDIEIISEAIPKRDYYLKSSEGSRVVNLHLQETALAFLAHNSVDDIAAAEALKKESPNSWQELWLEQLKQKRKPA